MHFVCVCVMDVIESSNCGDTLKPNRTGTSSLDSNNSSNNSTNSGSPTSSFMSTPSPSSSDITGSSVQQQQQAQHLLGGNTIPSGIYSQSMLANHSKMFNNDFIANQFAPTNNNMNTFPLGFAHSMADVTKYQAFPYESLNYFNQNCINSNNNTAASTTSSNNNNTFNRTGNFNPMLMNNGKNNSSNSNSPKSSVRKLSNNGASSNIKLSTSTNSGNNMKTTVNQFNINFIKNSNPPTGGGGVGGGIGGVSGGNVGGTKYSKNTKNFNNSNNGVVANKLNLLKNGMDFMFPQNQLNGYQQQAQMLIPTVQQQQQQQLLNWQSNIDLKNNFINNSLNGPSNTPSNNVQMISNNNVNWIQNNSNLNKTASSFEDINCVSPGSSGAITSTPSMISDSIKSVNNCYSPNSSSMINNMSATVNSNNSGTNYANRNAINNKIIGNNGDIGGGGGGVGPEVAIKSVPNNHHSIINGSCSLDVSIRDLWDTTATAVESKPSPFSFNNDDIASTIESTSLAPTTMTTTTTSLFNENVKPSNNAMFDVWSPFNNNSFSNTWPETFASLDTSAFDLPNIELKMKNNQIGYNCLNINDNGINNISDKLTFKKKYWYFFFVFFL